MNLNIGDKILGEECGLGKIVGYIVAFEDNSVLVEIETINNDDEDEDEDLYDLDFYDEDDNDNSSYPGGGWYRDSDVPREYESKASNYYMYLTRHEVLEVISPKNQPKKEIKEKTNTFQYKYRLLKR